MTALSADKPRTYELGDQNDLPVASGGIIYEGAAVGDNTSAYARGLVGGDRFRGFAIQKADNSAGANGAKNVRVKVRGRIALTVAAATTGDQGKPVYALDEDTFHYTAGTASMIGRVVRVPSGGQAVVEFDAERRVLGTLSEITDNSGGTASTGIANVTSTTYSGTQVANALATLTAQVNAIARMMK